jgi:hypothetical protein
MRSTWGRTEERIGEEQDGKKCETKATLKKSD